ncbi:hypothetical protein ABC733_05570 [Mangrovibacter sp. SLW1]
MMRKLLATLCLVFPALSWADTTLKIATISNGDMTIMQQLSNQYEQSHPGVHLQWHVMDDGALRKTIYSSMEGNGERFDVITVGTYEAPLWGEKAGSRH